MCAGITTAFKVVSLSFNLDTDRAHRVDNPEFFGYYRRRVVQRARTPHTHVAHRTRTPHAHTAHAHAPHAHHTRTHTTHAPHAHHTRTARIPHTHTPRERRYLPDGVGRQNWVWAWLFVFSLAHLSGRCGALALLYVTNRAWFGWFLLVDPYAT
jgi:hypothetical protein